MTPAIWPRNCCVGGRRHKPRGHRIIDHVTDRQAELSDQRDEILTMVVLLRTIAMVRGEDVHYPSRQGEAQYIALAKRIDNRVRLLLSVSWELQRAKELIDGYEHISD